MPNLLPAVLIGGPPNAGKSVLSYSLTRALRRRQVDHYLYRACPDGEGDWFQEGPEELVNEIRLRVRGEWSPEYAALAASQIERRPFPWLIDAGGRPGILDAPIFHACTHAILLTPSEDAHQFWNDLVSRYGLIVLADLHSDLHGLSRLETTHPVIRGTLADLRRFHLVTGEVIEAVADRLTNLFSSYDPEELRQLRLSQAPVETVLEVDRYAQDPTSLSEKRWLPGDLPHLVGTLPANAPLGMYGRAPIWVYGAVAAATSPAPLAIFDVRLGWIACPAPGVSPSTAANGSHPESGLSWRLSTGEDYAVLEVTALAGAHEIAYERIGECSFPALPPERGLICSGKLPNWLWAGLARCYQHLPWLAFYQLQERGAIVIASRDEQHRIGDHLDFTPMLQKY
jgi:CRISPR-associated protein Csx3